MSRACLYLQTFRFFKQTFSAFLLNAKQRPVKPYVARRCLYNIVSNCLAAQQTIANVRLARAISR